MKNILVLLVLLVSVAYVSCKPATNNNVWDNVPIQKLPFSMIDSDRDSVWNWMFSQESFNKHFNISQDTNEMDKMFHCDSGWKHLSFDFDFISNEPGHFFKRLPDVNHDKVLLFVVYDDKMEDDVCMGIKAWIQLQTFDSDGKFIDKLIVYAHMGSECWFSRNFTYDENNVIRLKDRKSCVDVSADDPYKIVYDAIATYAYRIDDDGKIVELPQEHTQEILVDKSAEDIPNPIMELDSNVICSTRDLDWDSTKWTVPEDLLLETLWKGNTYENVDFLMRLPDYNGDTVVITANFNGDDVGYVLHVVKSGLLQKGLDISPQWADPVEIDSEYVRKKFVIYKDYRIRIDTEEKEWEKPKQKRTDYYRINGNGEFYKTN